MNISVAMITLNEESNIERCLNSVKWADEIVIVDSGSTDRTIEIAKKYTDKIYYQKWLGYAEQRNISLSKVTGDWVFIIDADEMMTEELRSDILRAVKTETDKVAFTVTRKNYFMGRILQCYIESKLRLFRAGTVKFSGQVHEQTIIDDGPVGKLKGILYHYQYKDLDTQLNKSNKYSTLAARERYSAHKKCGCLSLVFRPMFDFIKRYILKGGFLDGVPGFVSAVLRANYTFAKFAKLYEMNKNEASRDSLKKR